MLNLMVRKLRLIHLRYCGNTKWLAGHVAVTASIGAVNKNYVILDNCEE